MTYVLHACGTCRASDATWVTSVRGSSVRSAGGRSHPGLPSLRPGLPPPDRPAALRPRSRVRSRAAVRCTLQVDRVPVANHGGVARGWRNRDRYIVSASSAVGEERRLPAGPGPRRGRDISTGRSAAPTPPASSARRSRNAPTARGGPDRGRAPRVRGRVCRRGRAPGGGRSAGWPVAVATGAARRAHRSRRGDRRHRRCAGALGAHPAMDRETSRSTGSRGRDVRCAGVGTTRTPACAARLQRDRVPVSALHVASRSGV